MIVAVLAMCWLACVVLICAVMKRVSRPPWWETVLLELDALELTVVDETTPTPRHHTV